MRRRRLLAFLLVVGAAACLPRGARAQTCATNVPHVTGTWVTLPYLVPINPIQATLLHTGQVLIVAGSENHKESHKEGAESYRAAVWDPTGTTTEDAFFVQNLTYDVFCSGTTALPDGRALVVGGTSTYEGGALYGFGGENRASIFDPSPVNWVR